MSRNGSGTATWRTTRAPVATFVGSDRGCKWAPDSNPGAHLRSRSLCLTCVGGGLNGTNVDLAHSHHGLHCPTGPSWIRITDQLRQAGWRNLPGDTELVPEPATHTLLTTVRKERIPVIIDFGLVGAVDDV